MPRHLSAPLADSFPPWIQERGQKLLDDGAVTIVDSTPAEVELSVRDDRPWAVVLRRRRDGPLYAACDCPAGRRGGGRCRHLWASLRAAESTGLLQGPPPAPPTAPRPAARRDARAQPPGDDWRARLRHLRDLLGREPNAAPDAPDARALAFVVDLPASARTPGLVIQLCERRVTDSGPPRLLPTRVSLAQAEQLADAHERELLASLLGASSVDGWSTRAVGVERVLGPSLALEGVVALALLPRACATGHCFVRRHESAELERLAWDDGPAWVAHLAVEAAPVGYKLQGFLRRERERRALQDVDLLSAAGMVFHGAHAARLDAGGLLPWLLELRARPLPRIPAGDAADLALELAVAVPDAARLEVPDELRVQVLTPQPRPRLAIRRATQAPGQRLECELSFDYDGLRLDQNAPARVRLPGARPRLLVRDAAAERRALDALLQAGVRASGRAGAQLGIAPKRVPRAVRELSARGFHVEAEGEVYRAWRGLQLRVVSEVDWFDLQGEAEFDGRHATFASVLQALRRGETMVTLDDGTFGLLPEEWLARFGLLARMGDHADVHTRFRRAQVGLLDALLAAEPRLDADAGFAEARRRLHSFEGIAACDAPPGFRGELRAYQREGLGFLRFLDEFGFGGCLADDMGLGKTVQVLARLAQRRAEAPQAAPALVVAPRSLIFNWKSEAARFTPGLRVQDHTGLERARDAAAFKTCDLLLTTYGTLRRDAALLATFEFDCVVLDEAQAIKNQVSETAKAARLLRGRRRLALSGTPVENHLGELGSLFEFLNPGMLGRLGTLSGRGGELGPEERSLLARSLRPFVLRRTKQQVAPDLPAKTEQTLMCELEGAQRRLYDRLRDELRESLLGRVAREGLASSKMHVLEGLLRLRQAACHAGLIDPLRARDGCAKLDALVPRLVELAEEGHKALVFSQFTGFLGLLRGQLDELGLAYEYLDGQTRDRQARVARFQEDAACRIFLVSLKAGGVGLNLTAAEYVFLLDPWWNPAVEAQAIDRSHRIGQSRPVFAYRLIAQDTVEEKVLQLQAGKRELADAILGAEASLIRDLKREDLELLLS